MSAEHVPHAPVTPIKTVPTAAELLERRAALRADAELIQDELEQIDAALIIRLDTVGVHDVDGTKVEIREYSRTDYKALEAAYPVAEYPQLYRTEPSLDQAAVKKEFAPAALDEFKVRGKKSVVVK
ncbi:hypothetical protein ACIGCK_04900 [Microbacterium sp. NPDC078428]|uniref:hypothetical protein n=1 Tax=Microbacterium sp. NPDC078428 TaxID=3364190 RepID=UPI0037C6FECA